MPLPHCRFARPLYSDRKPADGQWCLLWGPGQGSNPGSHVTIPRNIGSAVDCAFLGGVKMVADGGRFWASAACGILCWALVATMSGAAEDSVPISSMASKEGWVAGIRGSHGVPLDVQEQVAARALARAVSALQSGKLETARLELEKASKARPIADYVGLWRVRWLMADGQASAAARTALLLDLEFPDSSQRAQWLHLAGDAFAAEGEGARARASWTTALEITDDPVEREILESKRMGFSTQSPDPALDASSQERGHSRGSLGQAGAKRPSRKRSAEAAQAMAEQRVREGRGAEAVEAYREAIATGLEPTDLLRARLALGQALFRLRRYPEALPIFEQLGLDTEGRFWRARTLARLGRIEESIVGFEALTGAENSPLALQSAYLVATLLEGRGQSLRAMAHYRRVAAESPETAPALDALWRLGWSAWKRGDYAEASRYFQEMATRSEDEASRLRSLYWQARASEQLGEGAASRASFTSIARAWPLSYYGWRAQVRLDRFDPSSQGPYDSIDPGVPQEESHFSEAAAVRIALLTEAGLLEAARRELLLEVSEGVLAGQRVRVGRLWVAAGDYHRAQQLVIDSTPHSFAQGIRPGEEALVSLAWPAAYPQIVVSSADGMEGVDPELVWAIMREESSFRPQVMSSAGAMGLLQLMPETARRQAVRSGVPPIEDDDELFLPPVNIGLGTAYLAYLVERFPDRPSAIIGSYNAGPNAVERWIDVESEVEDDVWVEDIPYAQTRRYVKRVLRSLYVYQTLYPMNEFSSDFNR